MTSIKVFDELVQRWINDDFVGFFSFFIPLDDKIILPFSGEYTHVLLLGEFQ